MNDLALRPAADIGAVKDQFFTLHNFPLSDGTRGKTSEFSTLWVAESGAN